jgi:hypothetical protein
MLALNQQSGGSADVRLPTKTVRICRICGGGHWNDEVSMCHACGSALGEAEIVKHTYRIENVATQPTERITANDEERQRQGFELQTTFEWAVRDHVLDVRRGVASDAEGEIVRLAYGPGATITRINKGLRRRKNRTQLGFKMDPVSGYWAKNDDEDEPADPTISPRQWIVPTVQDRKNALLLQPSECELAQEAIATVQHALLRGIEAVFQLEEGEVLAEPMPTRDERTGFLFYEATEGGAGVLTRLAVEPDLLAEVARQALAIMHFDVEENLPATANTLVDVAGTTCVAACYRCVMSYYNQPDHELLDRRNQETRSLLLRLARSRLTGIEPVAPHVAPPAGPTAPAMPQDSSLARWLEHVRPLDLPAADPELLGANGQTVPLAWRAYYVAATFETPSPELLASLKEKGFEIVVLGLDASAWVESAPNLTRLLGRSA